jgi:hypothetical protein
MAYVCGAAQQQSNKFKVFVLTKGRADPAFCFVLCKTASHLSAPVFLSAAHKAIKAAREARHAEIVFACRIYADGLGSAGVSPGGRAEGIIATRDSLKCERF